MSPALLTLALAALLALQGACLAVDELLFHRRRRLRRWEALGHPLDTALFFAPVALAAWAPASWLPVYVAAAVLSCAVITKDEWVHAATCPGGEQWLHAVLFMLHPTVLIALGAAWQRGQAGALRGLLPVPVLGLAVYQLLYWNVLPSNRPLPWSRHGDRRAPARQQ